MLTENDCFLFENANYGFSQIFVFHTIGTHMSRDVSLKVIVHFGQYVKL